MATSVFLRDDLSLRVQRHSGLVSAAEIQSVIDFYQANPRIFLCDVIHLLDEDTEFGFGLDRLPAFRGEYGRLVDNAQPPLILRSVWVCPSAKAWDVLEEWLHERQSHDGLHTEVSLVGTLDEARTLFDVDEIAAARAMTGFARCFSA